MAGRKPTPRDGRRRVRRGHLVLGLACASVILAVGWWVWSAYRGSVAMDEAAEPQLPVHKVTHDSMCVTYTYDGETIRWYVMIDPDTSVQYVVNDRGGCTPRLGHTGDVMGVWGDEAS